MKIMRTKRGFVEACKRGNIPPLAVEIPFGRPADVFERFAGERSILLESGKGPDHIARYSFFAFDPYLEFSVKDHVVRIIAEGGEGVSYRKPLMRLREILVAYRQAPDPSLPPFQGGAVGMFSYDFVHYFERLPRTAKDDLGIPDAHFLIVDTVVAFDHAAKRAWIVVAPGARSTGLGYNQISEDYALLYEESRASLSSLAGRIDTQGADASGGVRKRRSVREIVHETDKHTYIEMVQRAKEYIAAGDIFQANIAQRLSADARALLPWELYRKLSGINPSPFGAFVNFGDYCIVSSSPERLVRYDGRIAETRPIAGTRPRGRNLREDESMRRDLLLNAKERAEHIMLIDLERNDLGKVCDYGTVDVDELMITEEYSHVIHIVSNIKGALSPKRDSFDLVRAVFPGGTITGVPKVRCMEIIDELEPVTRGPYTGSIGYIGFSGTMDMNIVIRTFVHTNERAYIHAGAGIVADSEPAREYDETLRKAEALIRTLFEMET